MNKKLQRKLDRISPFQYVCETISLHDFKEKNKSLILLLDMLYLVKKRYVFKEGPYVKYMPDNEYFGGGDLIITGLRDKTDEEINEERQQIIDSDKIQQQAANERKKQKEINEKSMYTRLKKKFEKGDV